MKPKAVNWLSVIPLCAKFKVEIDQTQVQVKYCKIAEAAHRQDRPDGKAAYELSSSCPYASCKLKISYSYKFQIEIWP